MTYQKKRGRRKIEKIIPYVLSDKAILLGDTYKVTKLIKTLGFQFKESRPDIYSDVYRNNKTGHEIVLVSIPKNSREYYYKYWIDSEEKVVPGLNLRYLLNEDFEDWIFSRGEWLERW